MGILSQTSILIGTSDAQIVASDNGRDYLALINDSPNEVYLGFGGTAAIRGGGIMLVQNGSWEANKPNIFTGIVRGIGSGSLPSRVLITSW